jgi:hypothetical protein
VTIILIDCPVLVIAVSTPVGILFMLCAELFGEFKKVINAALRPVKNAVVPDAIYRRESIPQRRLLENFCIWLHANGYL